MEQINKLEIKYKGKTLEKHMELLYKDLDKKLLEIENSSEYKSAESELNEFIEKNQLMEESTLYYLTKEKEENAKKLEEISENNSFDDLDDSIEYIDVWGGYFCYLVQNYKLSVTTGYTRGLPLKLRKK